MNMKKSFTVSLGTISALVVFATDVTAQAVNDFQVYTNRTSFTSRAFLGPTAGEILQGYPVSQYRGIGDSGAIPKECLVYEFSVVAQDQNSTTVEQYSVIFRRAIDGVPDGSPEGIIYQSELFDLPTTGNPSPAAWLINHDLGPEGVSIPCKDEMFFAGVGLSANEDWSADGQSIHASAYTAPDSGEGDPVRAGAPNHAYQVDAAGVAAAANPRSWRMWLGTERGAFQIGCIQNGGAPLFGNCGNYPDVSVHGLGFRIRDEDHAGKTAVLFVSDDLTGGARVKGVDGLFWVSPRHGAMMEVDSGELNANGELILMPELTAPGSDFLLERLGTGILPFTAVIFDENGDPLRTLNAQAADL